ncbi:MAG: tetratricopeptide repeat protein [Ferruginibacter sp.]|nr:tetratricopeptide repeat protein [Ferruginibacter sp.]
MAKKDITFTEVDNTIEETEIVKKDFLTTYAKPIIYAVAALVIGVGAYYGYKNLIKEPKEKEAAEAIFMAENLFGKMATTGFSKDSVNIVLNGGTLDGKGITGLLKVASNYSGTAAGNRAKYLIGAAYLQTKEFDKAISFLKDFDANGAYQTDIKKNMMLGHAFAELKKTDDALTAYKKAATVNTKDEAFTAEALLTAASYAETLGKTKDAIDLYQELKDKFATSQAVQSGDVDKYLARLGVTK